MDFVTEDSVYSSAPRAPMLVSSSSIPHRSPERQIKQCSGASDLLIAFLILASVGRRRGRHASKQALFFF